MAGNQQLLLLALNLKTETMVKSKAIYIYDAVRLLEDGKAHDIRLWKSNGTILEYKGVKIAGGHFKRGTRRVALPNSGLLREFRIFRMFEIDGLEVIL